ncbi:GIY-YIG nuclease family protein [Alkalibacillus haloalkaliphilus]|uniref:GIY-YIG nuclease family protein n=1 Tax=Alkalibacillus haloalkaliphilus TaxID=94136 RepID=UPI002935CDF1|nr:GIY-YIG nuclease family protein [Alkalibacillus haloalkaliphilus]MDV2581558.1 GIY-YIG nuclease family protein [Alkalibacillus haloalkaliphilus]
MDLMDIINRSRLNEDPATSYIFGARFGTIIQDAYTQDDAHYMVEALDDLCNPLLIDWGWASSGIYSFWDFETKELLYIGLAVNFAERFKQHNGIIRTRPSSCKYEKITDYFYSSKKIGYSILTMPSICQPLIRKNVKEITKGAKVELSEFKDEQFKRDVKLVEGILLESYKKKFGQLPPWNEQSGSLEGAGRSTGGNYKIVEGFTTTNYNHPLVAKCTLRELQSNIHYSYEEFLDKGRQHMLTHGTSFKEAMELLLNETGGEDQIFNMILRDEYLMKTPNLEID